MARRWRIAAHDPARISALQRGAGLPPVLARLLVSRGIDSPQAARDFLDPKLVGLRDPALLPGADGAATLLHQAIRDRRRLVVYGDYDADGMTATAILLRCFRILGAEPRWYVPHRVDEGYGLNDAALERLAAEGAHTVVTVDTGIASPEQAETAQRLGLQLIITDHHQVGGRVPPAAALVHPALPGHEYPFPGLCGAAVALKLAWSLCRQAQGANRVSQRMRRFLLRAVGLASIGTVADVVPLIDENRVLVRHGLRALRHDPLPGVAALERVCKLDQNPELSGEDVAFSLAPRLNAAGRLGQAEIGVELLTTDDPRRAEELASFLDELNHTRQGLERSVLLAARKQIKARGARSDEAALVLAERGWHAGVIGIVAGKLAEQHGRPTILISLDKLGVQPGIGSGRSAPGFDLAAALARCGRHLRSHGGHQAAAGLKIDAAKVDAFREDFCRLAAEHRDAMGAAADLVIDAETPLAALTHQTVSQIEQLAPFGHGNRRPMLCTSDVRLASPPRRMGAPAGTSPSMSNRMGFGYAPWRSAPPIERRSSPRSGARWRSPSSRSSTPSAAGGKWRSTWRTGGVRGRPPRRPAPLDRAAHATPRRPASATPVARWAVMRYSRKARPRSSTG